MAFLPSQVALNASTATALYAFETNQTGTKDDPIPITIICATSMYLGGSAVSTGNGFLLPANTPLNLQVFGSSEILYAIASASTPTCYVLMGRQ